MCKVLLFVIVTLLGNLLELVTHFFFLLSDERFVSFELGFKILVLSVDLRQLFAIVGLRNLSLNGLHVTSGQVSGHDQLVKASSVQ